MNMNADKCNELKTNEEKYQLISNVDNDNDDNDKSNYNTNKCREMQRIEWEMKGNINRFAMLTMLRYEEELQTAKETVCEGMMHALPAVNVNFHFSHFLRQGDLFPYGTEPMICQLKRKGSWVGCLGW